MVGDEARAGPQAWIVSMPRPNVPGSESEPTVWGLTAAERLRRSLLRAGVTRIDRVASGAPAPEAEGPCVVLRDDLFYDERLLAGLMESEDVVLGHVLSQTPEPVAAMCRAERLPEVVSAIRERDPAPPGELRAAGILDLVSAYDPSLRKSDPPFAYPTRGATVDLREIENRLFDASYKGITDLVTKWVFPRPARAAVRVLARRGVHPNTVTAFSYVLAIAVTALFAAGWFGTGLALGWLMTFLDTVDGKLARCTLTSSTFGNVFDHGLDLIHPPIWWAAWAMALPGGIAGNELAFWVVIGGYVVGRLLEGTFSLAFGIPMFVWRPFDAFFRTIIARRNPNMILLTVSVLIGAPVLGFQAVAAWTAICVVIAAARNVQGHIATRRGVEVHSWLDDAPEAGRVDEIATRATI